MTNGAEGAYTPSAPRARNRERVLAALMDRLDSGATQAQLAEATGLSRPSIKDLLDTLEPVLLPSRPTAGPGAGRRPASVRALDPEAAWVAAIDIGRSHIYVAVSDLGGAGDGDLRHRLVLKPELEELGFEISQSAVRTMERAAKALDDLVGENPNLRLDRLAGVTVGLPGPIVDGIPRDRVLNWGEYEVAKELKGALVATAEHWQGLDYERQVIVDNDATLSAIAEHRWGTGKGLRDVLYIKWSTGLGAGLIVDGEARRGAGGAAGEIAHWPVPAEVEEDFKRAGEPIDECPACGQRCFEAAIGFKSLLEERGWTYEDVQKIARNPADAAYGDLDRWLGPRAELLGRALVPIVNTLNPELVVVDGILDDRMEPLFERRVRRSLHLHGTMAAIFSDLNVCGGRFTVSAAARGGLARGIRERAPELLLGLA
jgi:predicted NBD/HSP70 family sugar kinase